MNIRRGWRWFRRHPPAVQAAAWILLAAAYTFGLVALLGGGDDEKSGVPAQRQMTPFEKRIAGLVAGVDIDRGEPGDVADFRRPRNVSARCVGSSECTIQYSIGLPGRGRILQDQRMMWQRLFSETNVQKATMRVLRDQIAAGVPPKEGEETVTGALMLTTTCDRTRRPNVDWSRRSGLRILDRVCRAEFAGQGGRPQEQETVAPDDPALTQPDSPGGR